MGLASARQAGKLMAIAVVVLATVAITGMVIRRVSEPSTSRRDDSAGRVERYLARDGALYVEFRQLSSDLLELSDLHDAEARQERCAAIAARLDGEVRPDDLFVAAAGIPDPVVAELALNDRTARSAALVSCNERDIEATNNALATVERIHARLTDLKVLP